MLIDTCVVIDLTRGNAEARAFIEGIDGAPSVSAITAMEVLRCARNRSESRLFERLFQTWTVLPCDMEIAQAAARLTSEFNDGDGADIVDALNAATAMTHDLGLATLHTGRFPMFPDLKPAY